MSGPRVRFAPSPTGYLHIGGARTALFNWLHARRNGGTFILRIEDTDRERSTPESLQAILDGLKWLGLDWDEGPGVGGQFGPYLQTERLGLYKELVDKLIADGKAYRCYCTKADIDARRADFEKRKLTYKYEGTCRNRTDTPDLPSIVRFKMPQKEGALSFDDKVLGKISKTYFDLDDWVMMRGDGIPLYNFGCVVDDHTMEITLVGRGQEHVNSTFPQLALYEALGWTPPDFAHFPLILGQDREKLSKRKHPEADVMLHAQEGVLPEALANFVVRLGWSHGDDEVITRAQMVEWFGFDHVGTTSGVWNPDKLQWLNQQYFKLLPATEVGPKLKPYLAALGHTPSDAVVVRVFELYRERARNLKEMANATAYFFTRGVTLDDKAAAKHLTKDSRPLLEKVRAELVGMTGDAWRTAALDDVIKRVSEAAQTGMGKVAQPVRVAITGGTASPGIGETLELIGHTESLQRIDEALSRTPAA